MLKDSSILSYSFCLDWLIIEYHQVTTITSNLLIIFNLVFYSNWTLYCEYHKLIIKKSNYLPYLSRFLLIPLELRLKKSHKPFQLAQMWDEFCELYTDSKPDEISRGEVLNWNMKDAGCWFFCRDIIHNDK